MLNLTDNQALILGLILAFPHRWHEEDIEHRTGLSKHAVSVSLRRLEERGILKKGKLAKGLAAAHDHAMTFGQEGALFCADENGFPV